MSTTTDVAAPRDWVSLSVAADRLSVSEKTLRRMIAQGRLTAYRFGPRLVRVDANELDALGTKIPAAGA